MSNTAITRESLAAFFGHDFLSFDAVDETAREYDFSENWNPDAGWGDETGWKLASHPDVEGQCEGTDDVILNVNSDHDLVIELRGRNGGNSEFTISLPDFDEDSKVTEEALLQKVRAKLAGFNLEEADTAELGDSIDVERHDNGFGELCELVGLDSDLFHEDDPEDDEQWFPMMNYIYPLPGGVRGDNSDTWHRVMNNMTLVDVDGEVGLALTGGGMHMGWQICHTYLLCGYLPPASFAGRLPRMSGSGQSEKDRMIMAACRFSLEARRDRAIRDLEDLERHIDEAAETAARKAAAS